MDSSKDASLFIPKDKTRQSEGLRDKGGKNSWSKQMICEKRVILFTYYFRLLILRLQ